MPLLVLSGLPLSGKTTRRIEFENFLKSREKENQEKSREKENQKVKFFTVSDLELGAESQYGKKNCFKSRKKSIFKSISEGPEGLLGH